MQKRRTFGSELRRIREAQQATLKDLAEVIDVSIVFISDVERDRRNPPPSDRIARLLDFLGATERLDEMLMLAAVSRNTVEISIENKPEATIKAIASLARRADDIPESMWNEILKLVSKGKDG
jgi:transcriptional regulator with XRE-family HTH domain